VQVHYPIVCPLCLPLRRVVDARMSMAIDDSCTAIFAPARPLAHWLLYQGICPLQRHVCLQVYVHRARGASGHEGVCRCSRAGLFAPIVLVSLDLPFAVATLKQDESE
jgi:hypothetical protein